MVARELLHSLAALMVETQLSVLMDWRLVYASICPDKVATGEALLYR
jgi:hypothetical protein